MKVRHADTPDSIQYDRVYTLNHYDILDEDEEPLMKNVPYGATIDLELPRPQLDGYEFRGWNTKPEGDGDTYFTDYGIEGDSVLYAQYYAIYYDLKYPGIDPEIEPVAYDHKITVDPNGGTYEGSEEKQTYIMTDEGFEVGMAERPYYLFNGWVLTYDVDPRTEEPNGNVTLTASWVKAHYSKFVDEDSNELPDTMPVPGVVNQGRIVRTITVDPNGGTYLGKKIPTTVNYKQNDELYIEDSIPVPDYIFVGYNVITDGDGNYTLIAHYVPDDVGGEDNPERDSDETPDIFEKKIIFRVVNGKWADGTDEKIITYVPLVNENGELAMRGTGEVVLPTGMYPNAGFSYEGAEWDDACLSVSDWKYTKVYTYKFPDGNKEISYNPVDKNDGEKQTDNIPENNTVTVDPNGGEYNGTTEKTVLIADRNLDIGQPVPPKGYNFTGWTKTADEKGNVTLTANYRKAEEAPRTEDSDIGLFIFFASLSFISLAVLVMPGFKRRRRVR